MHIFSKYACLLGSGTRRPSLYIKNKDIIESPEIEIKMLQN